MKDTWNKSEYNKLVRIKKVDLEFLREQRGKLSLAGYLHFIIQTYRAKEKI